VPPHISLETDLENPRFESIATEVCRAEGFDLIEFVGSGAFKETYKAICLDASLVAVKVFKLGLSNQRLEREIDALRRCSHPQVAKILAVKSLSVDRKLWLATIEEFLAGGTLRMRLDAGGLLSISKTRDLAISLIDAIRYIADLDLVHRDIKPDNIMFRDDGWQPVIVDFGLVRDLQARSLTTTWLPQGPGTPFFASPEQLNNDKALIDWRSDQFSLGVVLSMVATGTHPYAEEGDGGDATVERVIRRAGPSDRFRNSMQHVRIGPILKMVRPWPVHRFKTVRALADAWINVGV